MLSNFCNKPANKLENFDHLADYIPVGSLTLPFFDSDAPPPVSEWRELRAWEDAFLEELRMSGIKEDVFLKELCNGRFVKIFQRKHQVLENMQTLRVYIFPADVGRSHLVDHDIKSKRRFISTLMRILDCSLKSWEGLTTEKVEAKYSQKYNLRPFNDESLFYLFNTVRSPSPSPELLSCPIGKEAVTMLLQGTVRGLKTNLYPFQRRSSATMVAREVQPSRSLDPRVEPFLGPTGLGFYFDQVTGLLLRHRQEYEEVCGGILAETMGYGKTLICLAAILATKGHWPQVPPQYSLDLNPIRPRVGTLMEMAAAAVGRAQIPWRTYFEDMAGQGARNCLKSLEENIGSYIIPPPTTGRGQRLAVGSKPRRIILCSITLIIVPPNLLHQWMGEISLHLDKKALKLLLVDNLKTPLPPVDDLLSYDIILLVKSRFEKEMMNFPQGQRGREVCECSFANECNCLGVNSCSPLRNLHFLRIIVDEGHSFVASGPNGNNATSALETLCVERRWIVSGTPAAGLLGMELDTATKEVSNQKEISERASNEAALEAIKFKSVLIQEKEDIKKLGRIVIDFFKQQPWANSKGEDFASWQMYVMPSNLGERKPRSLRSIIESLVVRHRIEDIEQDVRLPPLYNRLVYLEPSWHDKLSINLFILSLTVNAVTSERTGRDYMFDRSNRTQLNKLVTKLRQSGFYWVGFTPQDVSHTLDNYRSYQEELSSGNKSCAHKDRILLEQVVDVGKTALASVSWKAFAELHEMGIYVEDFPAAYCEQWSLVQGHTGNPLLIGTTQLIEAQTIVDSRLHSANPELGLALVGGCSRKRLQKDIEEPVAAQGPASANDIEVAASPNRLKASSKLKATHEPKLTTKNTISKLKMAASFYPHPNPVSVDTLNELDIDQQRKSVSKPLTTPGIELLPSGSPLGMAKIVGTASAKLSYLLDRIIALQFDEKILIFYQGDHIAYFIAQALDLLDVRYLIYTATLGQDRQSAYATTFNTTETFRVMLMDINQAAHGLNIASASRVFFVNPVWQPNVEAQAIKRAHRIGQTRPVYVESLVLQGTLEVQMLERRKNMSTEEHQKAKKGPLDDPIMGDIIRNAEAIPLSQLDMNHTHHEMAKLASPQPLFGRFGRQKSVPSDPDADLILPEGMNKLTAKQRSVKRPSDADLKGGSSTAKRPRIGPHNHQS